MTDDCYYVCAAWLSGKTADELRAATHELPIKDLDGITALFTAAGLGSNVLPCGSVAGVRAAIMAMPGRFRAFGLAFVRLDGSGHMVIAHRGPGGVAFRDYQLSEIGYDATADLNTGTSFWVLH